MTIYQIKKATLESKHSQYFFSPKTMKFFGQKMRDFKVKKQPDGRYKVSAPIYDNSQGVSNLVGRKVSDTVGYFNPKTNEIEVV